MLHRDILVTIYVVLLVVNNQCFLFVSTSLLINIFLLSNSSRNKLSLHVIQLLFFVLLACVVVIILLECQQ